MSKTNYVNFDAVKEALEKYVKNEAEVLKVIAALTVNTVAIDEDVASEGTEDINESDDKVPKTKQEYVILVNDPDKQFKKDVYGWVLQIPENEEAQDVVSNICKGAYNFNASKKGLKYPVRNISQAIGTVSSKFFKSYGVKVKTKEPVTVVVTDGILPKN